MAAREARDDRAADLLGDAVDRLRVSRRRDRESCFNDVHAERIELTGQTKLLSHPQREPGCLLAVAQRRVENSDVFCHQRPHWRA